MNNSNLSPEQIKYQHALKHVKRIKGFYTHLMIYVLVNTGILIANYNNENYHDFWSWQNFSTVLCWGIGLVAHGLSVFLPSFVMGKDWEERKINELMAKEKQNKWE